MRPPVVLLAGGLGSRLAEETATRPKPMVEIGGRPILWHIMRSYSHFGFNEFYVALGYKGEVIKRYFLEYERLSGDLTIDLSQGTYVSEPDPRNAEDWILHLIDTGQATNTGGRLRRLEPFLSGGSFLLTYGDGLASVDLDALLRFHRDGGHEATITAVRSPSRFGALTLRGEAVEEFAEKRREEGWINGGFMVLEPSIFDYLDDDESVLEHALERLAKDGKLTAYRHSGFWQCMDTLHDRRLLESLWQGGLAPWKVWADAPR
jgi:glucose-1-phosphate cytidylyltransferase